MTRTSLASITALAIFALGAALPAAAQSLKDQLVGTWALTAGTEVSADGSKVKRWTEGRLTFDAAGNLTHFLIAPRSFYSL